MKVLMISEIEEDHALIKRIIKVKNPKLEVISVSTVEDAMSYAASDGPYAFFIIDCDLKETDPNALGLNLMEFTGSKPIFFVGSSQMIKDRIGQDLFSYHNLNDTLYKPTDRDDFAGELGLKMEAAVAYLQQEMQEDAIEEVEIDDYIPMRIKSFFLFRTFPYDLYISITTKSYMKIIAANKPYSHKTLTTYARKNVKHLYIKKDEQLQYLEAEAKKCIRSYESGLLAGKDTYLALLRGITILHQYVLAIGVTPTVVTLLDTMAEAVVNHYKISGHLPTILAEYPQFYSGVASKSLLSAFIAQAFANKIGWESPVTKKKLVVAAALQDITIPDETMNKVLSLETDYFKGFSPQEQDDFKNHPITSAEISKQFTNYPDVDFLIENHHEIPGRRGFPHRPSTSKFTQMTAIFNLSVVIGTLMDGEELSPSIYRKIYYQISNDYTQAVFKEVIKIYKGIFAL